jgi:diguanylate cyclase (GGDEF)-like protein
MISLKKHIDNWRRASNLPELGDVVDMSPGLSNRGLGLSNSGNDPRPKLPAMATVPEAVANHHDAESLPPEQWAEQALQRLEANEREMKEIIDVMARAVQSVTERDERYAQEVVDIAQRLRSVAILKDLARIRAAIVEGANSLAARAGQIAQDGRESLGRLTAKVEDYRSRLDSPESGLLGGEPEHAAGTLADDRLADHNVADHNNDPNANPAAQWVERASGRLGANRRELREIVAVIERAVESVTLRDERYGSEVGGIAERLRSIASLKDLANIRGGVIDNTHSLTACVERIVEDSKESFRRLTADVEGHRARLDSPEQPSPLDLVITDRLRLEEHLNARIASLDQFCLILLALKDLTRVSNRFGRTAGDDLLKQFALALRMRFPSAHLVTRCGPDEFAVITTASCEEAEARIQRIPRTALGPYKVNSGEPFVVAGIDAAIVVVEWDGAENSRTLLARGYEFATRPGS